MTRTNIPGTGGGRNSRPPATVAVPSPIGGITVPGDGSRRETVSSESIWDDFFASPGIDLGERDQPLVRSKETL
jgi:antitoxin VapB